MADNVEASKFGTFGGVFTPCVLTILGVIMFLRFGQIVGNSGLWATLAIVLASNVITLLTALSLSAIATNTRVKGGGAYFLISRSLGPEFGGVIGSVFFLAQAISVSMYIIGFTEAFVATFGHTGLSTREIASLVNLVTFICVYIGAAWTVKVQYFILGALGLSLLAFLAGALSAFSLDTLRLNTMPAPAGGASPLIMFALFFPAVTGIMAGANMSGDLKDPARSIPAGTLAAIAVTAVIYLVMAVLLAAGAPREELLNQPMIVKDMASVPVLITVGVFAATLSSALGSMMGAPRILQAFARDNISRHMRPFAKGSGAGGEPRRATILTFFIAEGGIMLGDLNAIAPIITMFFMITYGTLNLACFYEGITRNPSYRPRFRFSHWSLSLAGAIGCAVVMLLINPLWAVLSASLMGLLFRLISRAEIIARWGDVGSGVAFERARKALLKLEVQYYHPKNWRPAILALSGGAWSRYHLAEYAYWLAAGHGILTLGQIIPDAGERRVERRRQAEKRLRSFIHEEGLGAFPVVVLENSLEAGLQSLLQSHGIGGMRPNTVLLGLPKNRERWEEFCHALRLANAYERSILLVDCDEELERGTAPDGSIDVLWQGSNHGQLMVLLAHLIAKNPQWRGRSFRVLGVLPPKGDQENLRRELTETLESARIEAGVYIFSGEDLFTTLARRTGNTALLFVALEVPSHETQDEFWEHSQRLTKLVPDVIHVHSADRVSLET